MSDVQELLERQARWQKGRKSLSWPEKLRMAEAIRESVLAFRRTVPRKVSEPSPTPLEAARDEVTREPRGPNCG